MIGLGAYFWGFLALWMLLVVYLVRVDARAKSLRRQLDALRREIEESAGRSPR